MSKTIFENKDIKIVNTEHDYDFVGYVENKTDNTIKLLINTEYETDIEVIISSNDWIGFLANDEEMEQFTALINGNFEVIKA